MAAVKLTKHAAERMQKRNIAVDEIFRVLAFGEQMPTRRSQVYLFRIPRDVQLNEERDRMRLRNLRVVVHRNVDQSDDFTVVTAYRYQRMRAPQSA